MLFSLLLAIVHCQPCPFSPQKITTSMVNPRPSVEKFILFSTLIGNELFVGSNEALYRSIDNGNTLQKLGTPNENYWGAFKTTAGTILASGPGNLYRSVDNGKTFVPLNIDVPMPPGEPTYRLSSTAYNMFTQVENQIIWITQNFLHVSEDDGVSWQMIDCQGLQPNRASIFDCGYIFGRSMVLAPEKDKVIVAFSSFDLAGLYSLALPIKKGNGTFAPEWSVKVSKALCEIEENLCSDTGPMAFFNNQFYVGSGDHLLKFSYPFEANAVSETVLKASTVESEMTGLAASVDGTRLVATWYGSAFSRSKTTNWTAPNVSKCSSPGLFNLFKGTNPFRSGGFQRGLSPTGPSSTFIVGGSYGPWLWNV